MRYRGNQICPNGQTNPADEQPQNNAFVDIVGWLRYKKNTLHYVMYLAEAALAENFHKVEVVDAVLLDGLSAARRRDARSLYVALVAENDAHSRPGTGCHGFLWPTLHLAYSGRGLGVMII